MLLLNISLVLAYLLFQNITNFAENDFIKIQTYVLAALHLISIVLFALCIAAITISLYKIFVVDLLSGKSYKYYSLPYKKSAIIFSKAIPAIIIESITAVLLFDPDFVGRPVDIMIEKKANAGVFPKELIVEYANAVSIRFIAFLMFGVLIGSLILLAIVFSRSFDLSKSGRNLVLAIIIEVLANTALYIVIVNIEAEMDEKCRSAVMAIPELATKGVFSSKEIYPYIGLLAYWYEIISVITLVILIVEIAGSIIASKKLADKRMNVV